MVGVGRAQGLTGALNSTGVPEVGLKQSIELMRPAGLKSRAPVIPGRPHGASQSFAPILDISIYSTSTL